MIDLKDMQRLSMLTLLLVDKNQLLSGALHNNAPKEEVDSIKQESAAIRAEIKRIRQKHKRL